MAIVTKRDSSYVAKPKPFSWSYSKLKNYEVCPLRHYHVDLAKTFQEKDGGGEALLWGNAVHDALAKRCGPLRAPLPVGMEPFEKWAERAIGGTSSEILVEQNLALTEQLQPCGYFDTNTWFRAKGDLIKLKGNVALAVDWKTGKILEDSVQLALTAACIFAKYPEVEAVRCSYIWLKEDAESSETFYPTDMPRLWRDLWPRIEALKQSYLMTNYPAKKSKMCRSWCPVNTCPNFGTS